MRRRLAALGNERLQLRHIAAVPHVGGVEASQHGVQKIDLVGVVGVTGQALLRLGAHRVVSHIEHTGKACRGMAHRMQIAFGASFEFHRHTMAQSQTKRGRTHKQLVGVDTHRCLPGNGTYGVGIAFFYRLPGVHLGRQYNTFVVRQITTEPTRQRALRKGARALGQTHGALAVYTIEHTNSSIM